MNSTSEQLRFASIPGHTVRADFAGGGLSSDLGPLLLRGVDRQIGLTERLTAALGDRRHQSYISHSYRDLLTQRIFQIGCGYEDGNDSNSLRHDPMFKLGAARLPFEDATALASAATMSRFEHAASSKDIYRISEALVEQFIAGFASPPRNLILDLDHSEDAVYGQQPLAFYNHHYRSTCYLPLMIFDGQSGALVAAILRPGKRPHGAENAMIMRRVLTLIRRRFPDTHILVRGDGHFSGPELMGLIDAMSNVDFVFGFSSNPKLLKLAESTRLSACDLWAAVQTHDVVPEAVRLFDEFDYRARSWPRAWRVLLKAEVMALGQNSRFIVTSLPGLDAGTLYEEIYCARGQAENYIKHLKGDLAADRTSCTSFLANCLRLLLHAAAYVLHQQLRTQALQHTALSQAQPATVIAKLFKIAVQVRQCKNRIVLHLPSACTVKHLLQTLTERLYLPTPAKRLNSS
ncbi:IS1380 family transposase [Actimicrobium sp. CCI2.3]|uniref:IS1380 family transposase n=3 Tax=Actimicrobium sp. CCI2.3 TaxID=3048616 RepID=UPI002AB51660|nr:IS1380 family transposase [Actimicrobium sp. CCI2.3]MDY7574157.1 IS1380 family transposase [Actimicrobium sp. CCI2.3]MDY7574508.1 IS1380 family transposase [Actimicrobium sp. CCI2.3]MDY7575310.1 IS1380 family transposase [Actimicrobium sp. CCI2.3]